MKPTLIAILILIWIPSFAQFSFGIKGGINASRFHVKNSSSYPQASEQKRAIGIHLGAYVKLPLGKNFYFLPEMQFSQRGASDQFGEATLNYLEWPILFSYAPIKWVNIDAGPAVSINLTELVDNVGYTAFDLGLSTGVRINVHDKVSIIGRYYYGLKSIADIHFRDQNNKPDGMVRLYNRNVQFGISFKIL